MSAVLFDAQQAFLSALSNDAGVQALLGAPPRVYDFVPADAAFPYVVFGPVQVTPNDAKFGTGFEMLATLNVWSRYRGGKETREIFQALYDALHRAELGLTAQTVLGCAFHSADFGVDSDGLTYHAAVRFALITQET